MIHWSVVLWGVGRQWNWERKDFPNIWGQPTRRGTYSPRYHANNPATVGVDALEDKDIFRQFYEDVWRKNGGAKNMRSVQQYKSSNSLHAVSKEGTTIIHLSIGSSGVFESNVARRSCESPRFSSATILTTGKWKTCHLAGIICGIRESSLLLEWNDRYTFYHSFCIRKNIHCWNNEVQNKECTEINIKPEVRI